MFGNLVGEGRTAEEGMAELAVAGTHPVVGIQAAAQLAAGRAGMQSSKLKCEVSWLSKSSRCCLNNPIPSLVAECIALSAVVAGRKHQ